MQIKFISGKSAMISPNFIILLLVITTTDISGEEAPNKNENKIMYNDGHLVILNDAINDAEILGTWNEDIDLNKFIPPISKLDVKCMMHVDRYCSKPMARTKGLLIRALKDDCGNCTTKEKESIGKIVASMWAHDSQLWKIFLKRFDGTDSLKLILKGD